MKYKFILYILILIICILLYILLNKKIVEKYETLENIIGVLCFHQEWTDIINCLALINIYSSKYKTLYLIIRDDAVKLIQYYIKDIKNIFLLTAPKLNINNHEFLNIINNLKELKIEGYEYIALFDVKRPITDKYHNVWIPAEQSKSDIRFERKFYELYDLSFSDKIDKFELRRDIDLENEVYNRIVKNEPYICVHDREGVYPITVNNDYHIIKLAEASEIFFDYIKILQNAKEIHVIDSVWAAVYYQLDAKYRIFENIPIYVYCVRGHNKMFSEPINLPNWTMKE